MGLKNNCIHLQLEQILDKRQKDWKIFIATSEEP